VVGQVVFGSSLSDGNRYQHLDLPTLVAGGGAGKIDHLTNL